MKVLNKMHSTALYPSPNPNWLWARVVPEQNGACTLNQDAQLPVGYKAFPELT